MKVKSDLTVYSGKDTLSPYGGRGASSVRVQPADSSVTVTNEQNRPSEFTDHLTFSSAVSNPG